MESSFVDSDEDFVACTPPTVTQDRRRGQDKKPNQLQATRVQTDVTKWREPTKTTVIDSSEEDDSEALADRVKALLTDEEQWRQMGEAARKSVEEQFSQQQQITDLEQIYREVIEEGITPPSSSPSE